MTRADLGSTRRVPRPDGDITLIKLPALRFTLKAGPEKGRKWTFTDSAVRIGSAPDNDLVIDDSSVSREHAKITRTDKGVLFIDLESTNGTKVNGLRVNEAYLEDGVEIGLGETVLSFQSGEKQFYATPTADKGLGGLVGESASMRDVFALMRAIAPTTATVLIRGESGTGKEITARTIHEMSGRSGPYIVFDCASTGQDLIRSELFGHHEGAFTGATKSRDGAFGMAKGGTLFIDELGELPLSLQPNLLRVLETREIKPLGSDRATPIDVRVLTATNRDLEAMVREGKFREDLYHRVAVIPVDLPPLRDRPEDIPLIVSHLVQDLGLDCTFSEAALETMKEHAWPGNVRALRNAVERAAILCRGREVGPDDLRLPKTLVDVEDADTVNLAEIEKQTILKALARTKGRRADAASILGISVSTLRRKLKEYGSDVPDEED